MTDVREPPNTPEPGETTRPEPERPIRRLYRSRQERMIAGVAGGLAQYLDVDPALVRLGFVLLTLASGVGLLAYVILWIVVPERPEGMPELPITGGGMRARGRETMGFILIALGLVLLASTLGLFRWADWGRLWPLLLVGIGLLLLLQRSRGTTA